MVSLLIGLLYASLQLPLDNRENKNSRNVCLSQIRGNIFSRKFLLIQYIISLARSYSYNNSSSFNLGSGVDMNFDERKVKALYIVQSPGVITCAHKNSTT